jgi:hypothetical protein
MSTALILRFDLAHLWQSTVEGDGRGCAVPAAVAGVAGVVLDSINRYVPVVIINDLAAILFMIGYAPVRHRHDQDYDIS